VSYKSGGSTMCESAEISLYAVMTGLLKTSFFEVLRQPQYRRSVQTPGIVRASAVAVNQGPQATSAQASGYDRRRTPH